MQLHSGEPKGNTARKLNTLAALVSGMSTLVIAGCLIFLWVVYLGLVAMIAACSAPVRL